MQISNKRKGRLEKMTASQMSFLSFFLHNYVCYKLTYMCDVWEISTVDEGQYIHIITLVQLDWFGFNEISKQKNVSEHE